MNHPLDGARFKIVRAQEHLESLKNEIRTYLDTRPYKIIRQKYADGGIHPHPVATSEPPLRLSGLVGDVLTNVRAPLDYIVWQLAQKYFDPPVQIGKDKTWVSFPLYTNLNDEGFINKINRFANRKVPTDALAEIKAAQPNDGRNPAMWLLHELVNDDKHRMPHLTVGSFGAFMWVDMGPLGVALPPFRHHLSAETPTEGANVEVQAHNPVFVAFADSTMPDEPVDRTLEQIIKAVTDVIPRFERFFP